MQLYDLIQDQARREEFKAGNIQAPIMIAQAICRVLDLTEGKSSIKSHEITLLPAIIQKKHRQIRLLQAVESPRVLIQRRNSI